MHTPTGIRILAIDTFFQANYCVHAELNGSSFEI